MKVPSSWKIVVHSYQRKVSADLIVWRRCDPEEDSVARWYTLEHVLETKVQTKRLQTGFSWEFQLNKWAGSHEMLRPANEPVNKTPKLITENQSWKDGCSWNFLESGGRSNYVGVLAGLSAPVGINQLSTLTLDTRKIDTSNNTTLSSRASQSFIIQ